MSDEAFFNYVQDDKSGNWYWELRDKDGAKEIMSSNAVDYDNGKNMFGDKERCKNHARDFQYLVSSAQLD